MLKTIIRYSCITIISFIIYHPILLSQDIIVEEVPFKSTPCYATFPGGEPELRKYISNVVQIPDSVLRKVKSDKVIVNCIINKTGEVGKIKIINNPDTLLGNEVIKALKKMPKWIPGKASSIPALTMIVVPVYIFIDGKDIDDSNIQEYKSDTLVNVDDVCLDTISVDEYTIITGSPEYLEKIQRIERIVLTYYNKYQPNKKKRK